MKEANSSLNTWIEEDKENEEEMDQGVLKSEDVKEGEGGDELSTQKKTSLNDQEEKEKRKKKRKQKKNKENKTEVAECEMTMDIDADQEKYISGKTTVDKEKSTEFEDPKTISTEDAEKKKRKKERKQKKKKGDQIDVAEFAISMDIDADKEKDISGNTKVDEESTEFEDTKIISTEEAEKKKRKKERKQKKKENKTEIAEGENTVNSDAENKEEDKKTMDFDADKEKKTSGFNEADEGNSLHLEKSKLTEEAKNEEKKEDSKQKKKENKTAVAEGKKFMNIGAENEKEGKKTMDINENEKKEADGNNKANEEKSTEFDETRKKEKVEKNAETENEETPLLCSVKKYYQKSEEEKVKLALTWLSIDDKKILETLQDNKKLNIKIVQSFSKYDLYPSFYSPQFKVEILRNYFSVNAYKHLEQLVVGKTDRVQCFSCSEKFKMESAVVCESCLSVFDPKCAGSDNMDECFYCSNCT